ncbi:MAG TPA: hypothetical protein ENN63_01055 [Bacteroidetes bacterium]|nr:hypothetical protein [Bacteroidota bacterium]
MAIILNISENSGMPYEKRNKNVLYQADEFKIRIIDLPENGSVPPCEMVTYVVFTVMQGEVIIMADGVPHHLSEKQSLVSEPAVFSMKSSKGAKLMGIQIKKRENRRFDGCDANAYCCLCIYPILGSAGANHSGNNKGKSSIHVTGYEFVTRLSFFISFGNLHQT